MKSDMKSDAKESTTDVTDEYKELFSKLRNIINASKDSYKASLVQTKELIEQKEEELKILKIRKNKFEGAIEASESFLTAVLPSNNKK